MEAIIKQAQDVFEGQIVSLSLSLSQFQGYRAKKRQPRG